jgi:hypothetical protein
MNNKVAECELVASKIDSAHNLNIATIKSRASEIQDEVKKIKENSKYQEENSKKYEYDTENSSLKDPHLECSSATKDKDVMEIRNMSLTIGPCETKEQEKDFSSSYNLQFDMTKIPNNFLNAKNYGDYFFNYNSGRDGTNQRQLNQNNVIFLFTNY